MTQNERTGPYRCPAETRFPDDIAGCGSFNTVASLEAGHLIVDCLDCGIWFDPTQETD